MTGENNENTNAYERDRGDDLGSCAWGDVT